MRVLDLFSGIGGFSLGLERAGMETVAFCEFEEFPRKVLAKHWPDVPCYPDVRTLTKEKLIEDWILADTEKCGSQGRSETIENNSIKGGIGNGESTGNGSGSGAIDLICGGYPCQPFSHAGKRGGADDDRHLWPEMYRLIETIRPRWVLAENVAGHISMGLDDVLSDLEAAHYAWWTFVIPACAVDARHRRDRVWIVADSKGEQDRWLQQRGMAPHTGTVSEDVGDSSSAGLPQWGRTCRRSGDTQEGSGVESKFERSGEVVAHSHNAGLERGQDAGNSGSLWRGSIQQSERCTDMQWRAWEPEPSVGRVAHGISGRVDRLKSLGNAVVPQVVEMIGRAIMAAA